MHTREAKRALAYSVRQVLETMCFAETEAAVGAFHETRVISTSVAFHGTWSGCVRMEMSRDAADWLAASFLGVRDAALESGLAEETLFELGNVICGRFVSLLDPSADLRMDAPVPMNTTGDSAGFAWQHFRAEAGVLRVAFEFTSTEAE